MHTLETAGSLCKRALYIIYQVISQMFSPKAIEKDNEDAIAMVLAAKTENFPEVFQIMEKKPNIINVIPAELGWSVLHEAVYCDNVDVVKRILSLPNCDTNIKAEWDWAGMSPYQQAKKGDKKCQSLLKSTATETSTQTAAEW